MLQRVYPPPGFFNLCGHHLTGFLTFCQFQHIRQNVRQGFHSVIQVGRGKCKPIGVDIIGIGCACFIMELRNFHAHDVFYVCLQKDFLFGRQKRSLQCFVRHHRPCQDKVFVGGLNTLLHPFPQDFVFSYQVQKLPHQFVPFVLQQLMSSHGYTELSLELCQFHTCWVYMSGSQKYPSLLVRCIIVFIQKLIIDPFQFTAGQNAKQFPAEIQRFFHIPIDLVSL